MSPRLKIPLSVPRQGAECYRGWRPGPGPFVVGVEETEVAHLARMHRRPSGAVRDSTASALDKGKSRSARKSWRGCSGSLSLESRDAVPAPPAHMSSAEQTSTVRLGLRSAGDRERALSTLHLCGRLLPRESSSLRGALRA